jgi:hypothetical protein
MTAPLKKSGGAAGFTVLVPSPSAGLIVVERSVPGAAGTTRGYAEVDLTRRSYSGRSGDDDDDDCEELGDCDRVPLSTTPDGTTYNMIVPKGGVAEGSDLVIERLGKAAPLAEPKSSRVARYTTIRL